MSQRAQREEKEMKNGKPNSLVNSRPSGRGIRLIAIPQLSGSSLEANIRAGSPHNLDYPGTSASWRFRLSFLPSFSFFSGFVSISSPMVSLPFSFFVEVSHRNGSVESLR